MEDPVIISGLVSTFVEADIDGDFALDSNECESSNIHGADISLDGMVTVDEFFNWLGYPKHAEIARTIFSYQPLADFIKDRPVENLTLFFSVSNYLKIEDKDAINLVREESEALNDIYSILVRHDGRSEKDSYESFSPESAFSGLIEKHPDPASFLDELKAVIKGIKELGLSDEEQSKIVHYITFRDDTYCSKHRIEGFREGVEVMREIATDAEVRDVLTQSTQKEWYEASKLGLNIFTSATRPAIKALLSAQVLKEDVKNLFLENSNNPNFIGGYIEQIPAMVKALRGLGLDGNDLLSGLQAALDKKVTDLSRFRNAGDIKWLKKLPLTPSQKSLVVCNCIENNITISKFRALLGGLTEAFISISDDPNERLKYALDNLSALRYAEAVYDSVEIVKSLQVEPLEIARLASLIGSSAGKGSIDKLPNLFNIMRQYNFSDGQICYTVELIMSKARNRDTNADPIQAIESGLRLLRDLFPNLPPRELGKALLALLWPSFDANDVKTKLQTFMDHYPSEGERLALLEEFGCLDLMYFLTLIGENENELKAGTTSPDELLDMARYLKDKCNVHHFYRYSLKIYRSLLIDDPSKPVVLVVTAKMDWNGAFQDVAKDIEAFIDEGYRPQLIESDNEERVYEKLDQLPDGLIKAMLIEAHGRSYGSKLGYFDDDASQIGPEDQVDWKKYAEKFAPDATIIFMSCDTGRGSKCIVVKFAKWLEKVKNGEIYGPICPFGDGNITFYGGKPVPVYDCNAMLQRTSPK
jgi:hypothetical protein